jgi:hypothetical protein
MLELVEQLKLDLDNANQSCNSLNINSTDYAYWNGVRCQVQTTMNKINNLGL